MMMQALFVICAMLCTAVQSRNDDFPNTKDMLTNQDMDHIWMEIGYTSLNNDNWQAITTTVVNFDRPLSVFFSLPEYGNSSFQDSYPLVPKLNGSAIRQSDGSYTFYGMLVMPDDAQCSSEWWVPEKPDALEMPWLIAEQGVYNLSGNMIIIQEGNITRENSNVVFDDTPHLTHHTVVLNYTTGCDQTDSELPCTYPSHPDNGELDAVAPRYTPWMKVGSLQQLQTNRRKAAQLNGDLQLDANGNPQELFVSVRGRNIYTDRAQYMIATHSVTDSFPDYETILTPEVLAIMIYQKSLRIRCTEGLVIETQIFYTITSAPILFNYENVFDFAPGLFAMLGSLNSVRDSTILRSFNRTKLGSMFITQEDQCVDNEQEHTTQETAFAFVVGQSTEEGDTESQNLNCFIVFKNNLPTGVPTGEPTGYPSGDPSSAPSGEPSGVPSSLPSAVPSGQPTLIPTAVPTTSPTPGPTAFPTAAPTRGPTAVPTLSPTAFPTDMAGNCTFNFLLFDLFGDGFYTTYVNLTTTKHLEENSTSQYHQPNCTAKVVSVYSETCSIDVSMLTMDGSNPLLTWESYWILNFEGETYIGDFFSKLSVVYGRVLSSENLVDYSVPGQDNNKCHECPHPPKYNANIPPGVCESSATAKVCPPPAPGKGGPGAGGPGGPGAGGPGAGGPGAGAGAGGKGPHRALSADDDANRTATDDDHSGHNHTDTDDRGDKDDDHSGHNHTDTDDRGDKDDDHSGHNHTDTDDRSGSDDDRYGRNHTDDDFFSNYNSTDDGSGGGNDDHIHYSYGKPKPKPKPPYLVYINMYDELSNGFLDKSGDWSDYFNTQEIIGTGGAYADLNEPILVPNVLAYPKYYLMTKDRQKLIKSPKSICSQKRGTEFCQEALPWNGHFIFRFAGIEPTDPADAATWDFCGVSGGINEEFEFIMREGVCYPLTNKLTADAYCEYGFETAINMNGVFNIAGNFNSLTSLSELDTSLLEKELALLMPGDLSVTINSVTHEEDNSFNVYFKTSIIAESMGYDGTQVDKVETMMYELEATLSSAFETGLLKNKLIFDLNAVANTQDDVLRQATDMKLVGFMEIDSMNYQDKHVGASVQSGDIGGSWSVPENIELISSPVQQKDQLSETAGIISLAGVVVGCLVAVMVATSIVKHRNGETVTFGLPEFGSGMEDHSPLSGDSEHVVEQDTQIEEASAHPLPASSRPLVDLSLSSVEAGHKAIHYEDDIDTALFNHSKQQYQDQVANKRSFI